MEAFITVLHVLTCIALIAIVLLQHGRGADIGATFGGGASQTVFGSRGAGNFLTKLTTGAAVFFMISSLTLSYFAAPSALPDLIEDAPAAAPIDEPEVELPESTFPEAQPIPEGEAESDAPAGFEELAPPVEGDDAP